MPSPPIGLRFAKQVPDDNHRQIEPQESQPTQPVLLECWHSAQTRLSNIAGSDRSAASFPVLWMR